MAKKSEPPKPIAWGVYKITAKAVWLNTRQPHNRLAIDLAAAAIAGSRAVQSYALRAIKPRRRTITADDHR